MKLCLIAAIFGVLSVVAFGAATRCGDEDDCEEDECCLVKGFNPMIKGVCKKLGEEGNKCQDEDERVDYFGGKFFRNCPCKEGMDCVPEEVIVKKHEIIKKNERCTVITTSEPEVTTSEPEVITSEPEEVTDGEDVTDGEEITDGGDGGEDGGEDNQ